MTDVSSVTPTRGRLLVADDEPHIRRILTTLLEMSDFVVDAVSDGVAALELLGGSVHYDLILLDIMMPGASGLEVLRDLRGLPQRAEVPVMILTAKGQDADRDEAFALGAADFVTKPFSPKKLLARIDELLDA
jgi:two-component system alkaline phosphatase synthesis response regulator PhoP